jgi:hypothetical protein
MLHIELGIAADYLKIVRTYKADLFAFVYVSDFHVFAAPLQRSVQTLKSDGKVPHNDYFVHGTRVIEVSTWPFRIFFLTGLYPVHFVISAFEFGNPT